MDWCYWYFWSGQFYRFAFYIEEKNQENVSAVVVVTQTAVDAGVSIFFKTYGNILVLPWVV